MASNLKIDLRQLNTFLTVAERGSFSRASEVLFIAQPALSRQIRLLEEALGVEVFLRYGRGVVLTTAGKLLYDRGKAILQDFEQMQSDVTAVSGEVTGQVILGLLPTVSHALVSEVIEDYRRLYPKVTFAVRSAMSGTLQQMVSQHKIDLAITYDQKRNKNLRYIPLLEERFYLIAPPEAEVANRTSITLGEVFDLPLILPEEKHGLRMKMEMEAANRNKSLNMAFEVSAWPMLSEIIRRNLGYTVLSSATVHEMVIRKEVVAIPIIDPEVYRPIAIVTPSGIPSSVATMKLIDVILEKIAKHVKSGNWGGKLLFQETLDDQNVKNA